MQWHSHTMQTLANRGEPGPAANEVWYWSASQVTLYSQTGVASHAFADGQGVITYTADLTSMPDTLRGTSITHVQIPVGVTSIGRRAFLDCTLLSALALPDSVVSFDSEAFRATALAWTSLPPGLTSIGNNAFWGCTGLAISEIPATVTSIGGNAFRSCTGLTSLTFLGTPDSISSSAFAFCSNLATVRVPWSQGAVADAPWSANHATITYNYTP